MNETMLFVLGIVVMCLFGIYATYMWYLVDTRFNRTASRLYTIENTITELLETNRRLTNILRDTYKEYLSHLVLLHQEQLKEESRVAVKENINILLHCEETLREKVDLVEEVTEEPAVEAIVEPIKEGNDTLPNNVISFPTKDK